MTIPGRCDLTPINDHVSEKVNHWTVDMWPSIKIVFRIFYYFSRYLLACIYGLIHNFTQLAFCMKAGRLVHKIIKITPHLYRTSMPQTARKLKHVIFCWAEQRNRSLPLYTNWQWLQKIKLAKRSVYLRRQKEVIWLIKQPFVHTQINNVHALWVRCMSPRLGESDYI